MSGLLKPFPLVALIHGEYLPLGDQKVAWLQGEGSNYSAGPMHIYWDDMWNLVAVANEDHNWWIIEEKGLISLEPWEWNHWVNDIQDDRYSQWLPPRHMR